MSHNIYVKRDGKRELVETGANDRTCKLYKECCPSAEFENHAKLPSDEELSQIYGVRDAKCLESAWILTLCMVAAGLLVAGAVLLEML